MTNEILQEVWRNRDEFARQHGYDIDAMVAALNRMQQHSVGDLVEQPTTPAKPGVKRKLHSSVRKLNSPTNERRS